MGRFRGLFQITELSPCKEKREHVALFYSFASSAIRKKLGKTLQDDKVQTMLRLIREKVLRLRALISIMYGLRLQLPTSAYVAGRATPSICSIRTKCNHHTHITAQMRRLRKFRRNVSKTDFYGLMNGRFDNIMAEADEEEYGHAVTGGKGYLALWILRGLSSTRLDLSSIKFADKFESNMEFLTARTSKKIPLHEFRFVQDYKTIEENV